MSDSKSRGGKKFEEKIGEYHNYYLKKNIKVTLFTTFFLKLISSWFLLIFPFLHPLSSSALWAPLPLFHGEFFELSPVSLNTNTFFSCLFPIQAMWLLVPCERNPGLCWEHRGYVGSSCFPMGTGVWGETCSTLTNTFILVLDQAFKKHVYKCVTLFFPAVRSTAL